MLNHWMNRFGVILLFVCCCTGIITDGAAVTPPPFAPWVGDWEGELVVYSATGDRLETFHVKLSSAADAAHASGLQKISLALRSSKDSSEKQNGLLMSGASGLRRVLKGEKGETVSDLRGRLLGPAKFYWFSVDTNGVLREAYLETIEDDTARINGFRWDGERSGSYRIIEGVYRRAKAN